MTRPSDRNLELDWEGLSTAWRALAPSSPIDATLLRARVDGQKKRARAWRVLELVVTAIYVWWFALEQRPGWADRVIAGDIVVILAITWTFVWLGRRGRERPASATTMDYVAVARLRARQRIAMVWLALSLLVAQWFVALALSGGLATLAVACSILWSVWAAYTWRAARRELHWLDRFELDDAST
jgi:hypothetical protein